MIVTPTCPKQAIPNVRHNQSRPSFQYSECGGHKVFNRRNDEFMQNVIFSESLPQGLRTQDDMRYQGKLPETYIAIKKKV